MSKGLETIRVLDDYLLVDTTNRRVCEMSNPTYDRMFRGSRFANEMATLLVEYRNRIAELEEQLKNATPKFKYHQVIYVLYNNEIIKGEIDSFDYFNKNYLVFLMKFDLGNEWFYEHEIFATKEDALKKLKELKGENK